MVNYEAILLENSEIENQHIILRPFTISDAQDFFEIASDENVTEYLTWKSHINIEQSINSLNERFIGKPHIYAIELKNTKKCIGCIDLRITPEHEKTSFGFMLNREYWGKGYMTEALESVIELVFNKLKLNRIESTHYTGNEGSGRVMEKCGMKYEGKSLQELVVKKKFVDIIHYGLIARDYISTQNYGK